MPGPHPHPLDAPASGSLPCWKWIDLMERAGEKGGVEAQRWKRGIFGLMELWGLEPNEVACLSRPTGEARGQGELDAKPRSRHAKGSTPRFESSAV